MNNPYSSPRAFQFQQAVIVPTYQLRGLELQEALVRCLAAALTACVRVVVPYAVLNHDTKHF